MYRRKDQAAAVSAAGAGVFGDQFVDPGGELSADAAPVGDAIVLEQDAGGVGAGIVGTDDLNAAAVAGAAFSMTTIR